MEANKKKLTMDKYVFSGATMYNVLFRQVMHDEYDKH